MIFDSKWAKAKTLYDAFVKHYDTLTYKWEDIRQKLFTDWGYQAPSLVEIEGYFFNIRFKTPKQAITEIKKAQHSISISELNNYESNITQIFRSRWSDEITKNAN